MNPTRSRPEKPVFKRDRFTEEVGGEHADAGSLLHLDHKSGGKQQQHGNLEDFTAVLTLRQRCNDTDGLPTGSIRENSESAKSLACGCIEIHECCFTVSASVQFDRSPPMCNRRVAQELNRVVKCEQRDTVPFADRQRVVRTAACLMARLHRQRARTDLIHLVQKRTDWRRVTAMGARAADALGDDERMLELHPERHETFHGPAQQVVLFDQAMTRVVMVQLATLQLDCVSVQIVR